MKEGIVALKVKVKHLAEEARIIRKEEQKLSGMAKWKLQHHRKTKVRDAARRTQVAYQILRGRDWASCAKLERITGIEWYPVAGDRKEIERMLRKYGDETRAQIPAVHYPAPERLEDIRMVN